MTKNFQDIYIFLKFLSKTLLSCPTLLSEIEEYKDKEDFSQCLRYTYVLYSIQELQHNMIER